MKILKNHEYQNLLDGVRTQSQFYDELCVKYDDLVNTQYALMDSLSDKDTEIAQLKEQLEVGVTTSDTNFVKMTISDDLEKVTPTIKVKSTMFELLVQEGYLSDTQEGNSFAMQLAMISIAHEALTQLLESFTEAVE